MREESKIKKKIKKARQMMFVGLYSLKRDGIEITAKKALSVLGFGKRLSYRKWVQTPLYTEEQLNAQRNSTFEDPVLFSIITPLYNTREDYLKEMVESVLSQTYPYWELCLGDGSDDQHGYVERICREYADRDQRIKYKKLRKNYGIAGNSNACIEMAGGEYISLLDHDDILHPAALYDTAMIINRENADFVYTDEALFHGSDLTEIKDIHFKKDYAPDDLRAVNYICHFTSFKRALIDKCGGFREGFDGSQDHELFLRLTDAARQVSHIPEVLYYWRAHSDSTAENAGNKAYAGESGKRAVKSYLEASGIRAEIRNAGDLPTIYRVIYEIPEEHPRISMIIPNCDHAEDLRVCVSSILNKTSYDNYEIIIVENNSKESEIFEYYKALRERDNIKVVKWPGAGFNWSAINNFAVREAATGEYIVLLNNDTEVISPDWIQEMLMYAQRRDVGVVGAMMYYPDNRIQHAGVIIGLGGIAGHVFRNCRRGETGYMARLRYAQNLSAVTGACMMIRKSVYEELSGMNEQFASGMNDIDFCLRVRETGRLIVWTPHAELYHYESKSRGLYDNPEDRIRLEQEKDIFCERWAYILGHGDPYYNPNLSLMSFKFEPKQTNTGIEKKDKKKTKYRRRYDATDHTFVVLAYIESPYLEECIRSVMSQTVRGDVLVCTSTPNDHIIDLAEKYSIPVCINDESRGIGADWNFAYEQAKTPLVTLTHQDDIYEKTFLEKTLEQISRSSDPLIAFTDYYEIQGNRIATHNNFVNLRIKKILLTPLRSKIIRSSKRARRLLLSFADPICCPSVTYVKDNLPRRLFDEKLHGSVDWAAWESLSKREGAFLYIPETLLGHRMYTGSSTLELIRSGKRKKEDYEVLKRFWPKPIAKSINHAYSLSQKGRFGKKS